MKYPNFLIVGAAKSGSTTLYQLLTKHPDVYMPANKEPNFFVADYQQQINPGCPSYAVDKRRMVFNESEYQALFEGASNFKAVGEATVTYLYKPEVAIPRIKEYLGDPKILIILRNPIERALSQYSYCVEMGFEKLGLSQALKSEQERLGKHWSSIFAYIDQSRYSGQISAYLESFSNVKILIMEEFISREQEEMVKIFEFLGIDSKIELKASQKFNVSGVPRYQWLHNFLIHKNPVRGIIKNALQPIFGEDVLSNLSRKVRSLNQCGRVNFDTESRDYVAAELFKEIAGVEAIIGRPVPSWRKE